MSKSPSVSVTNNILAMQQGKIDTNKEEEGLRKVMQISITLALGFETCSEFFC